jgi:hypothetical protein
LEGIVFLQVCPSPLLLLFIEATARPTWPVSTKLVYIYMYKHQMHHIK